MLPVVQLIASPAAYALIREFEGLRTECYLCPANIATIGYGHTGPDVAMGMRTITLKEADDMLGIDVAKFEKLVRQHVKAPMTQGQFDAMVSILFNVGPGTPGKRDGIVFLKSGNPSTLLRRLNAGDYAGAAEQFDKWVNGGGKVLPGLVRRRAAEKALFLSTVGIS